MIKNGDFIKLEYSGFDKNGNIFDSTKGEIAKKLRDSEGPILIVYGHGQLLKGLEIEIKDMKEGDEKEVTLNPDKAFGEKKKDLLNVMKEEEFKKHNVMPQPGLTVHLDYENKRMIGVIKSVTSGRILVDFNHPLAGQTVKYKLKLIKIISNINQKLDSLIEQSPINCNYDLKDEKLVLDVLGKKDDKTEEMATAKKMKDEDLMEIHKLSLVTSIKQYIPEIKTVELKK